MFEDEPVIFLYVKDYRLRQGDQFYLYEKGSLRQCSAADIVSCQHPVITHDYGMIAGAIFGAAGRLPARVVDINELHRATVGERTPLRATRDIAFQLLNDADLPADILQSYAATFFGRDAFDSAVYLKVAEFLEIAFDALVIRARNLSELDRFVEVEIPVSAIMWRAAVKGIGIDTDRLREFKRTIDDDYYRQLKQFSLKHGVAFELPADSALTARLEDMGMDIEGASLDYILSYLHFADDFGEDLLSLRKVAKSRSVMLDIPVGQRRAFPLPVVAGTVTSRILLHGPSLQNLGKKYRHIIRADEGKVLEYVDFAQFEVGIMVGLADDPAMRGLYESGDLYAEISRQLFGDVERRKIAKRLFLSYSYGMTLKRVVDAAVEQGARRENAVVTFRSFPVFEAWKKSVQALYKDQGRVATSFGNNLIRRGSGPLTGKEARSCVSQLVQGTASLIFKRALIELDTVEGIDVLITMHDAVLFQTSLQQSGVRVKQILEEVFDRHFDGAVRGRAEVSAFF